MTLYIRPYKRNSASVKLLRQALQIKNFSMRNTVLRDGDTILNWGGQDGMPPTFNRDTMQVINRPEAISLAVSKVETLEHIASYTGNSNFFTSRSDLMDSLGDSIPAGMIIYCRTLTRASKGRGIVVAKALDDIVDAPLYTCSYPCKREYRVHVFNQEVIDLVAKVRITDSTHPSYKENPDPYIRNSETGYVFARNAVKVPDSTRNQLRSHAIDAVSALGLDFGAVDIVRDVNDNFYVLEVNTAPGIMGSALAGYVNAINQKISYLRGSIVEQMEGDSPVAPATHTREIRNMVSSGTYARSIETPRRSSLHGYLRDNG